MGITKMHKLFLGALVFLAVSSTAQAMQTADQMFADPSANTICKDVQQASNVGTGRDIGTYMPPNPNTFFGSGSCLDNILNTKISLMFGMPDIGSILGTLIDSAKNAVCNVANTAVSNALGNISTSYNVPITLPGGQVVSPGVSVGQVYAPGGTGMVIQNYDGSTTTVGTSGATTTTATRPRQTTSTTTLTSGSSSGGGFMNTIKNLFR